MASPAVAAATSQSDGYRLLGVVANNGYNCEVSIWGKRPLWRLLGGEPSPFRPIALVGSRLALSLCAKLEPAQQCSVSGFS
jgi:hypothetical protein